MKRATVTLALGIAVGAGMTGFVNAMQHVKVTELYKANLVTSLPPRTVPDDRNASQTTPLKFLVFHVAKKGEPLAVPAQ